jgi:hypothetical protein
LQLLHQSLEGEQAEIDAKFGTDKKGELKDKIRAGSRDDPEVVEAQNEELEVARKRYVVLERKVAEIEAQLKKAGKQKVHPAYIETEYVQLPGASPPPPTMPATPPPEEIPEEKREVPIPTRGGSRSSEEILDLAARSSSSSMVVFKPIPVGARSFTKSRSPSAVVEYTGESWKPVARKGQALGDVYKESSIAYEDVPPGAILDVEATYNAMRAQMERPEVGNYFGQIYDQLSQIKGYNPNNPWKSLHKDEHIQDFQGPLSKAYRDFEAKHKGKQYVTPFDRLKHYYDVRDFPTFSKKHRKFTSKFRRRDMELLKEFFDERWVWRYTVWR